MLYPPPGPRGARSISLLLLLLAKRLETLQTITARKTLDARMLSGGSTGVRQVTTNPRRFFFGPRGHRSATDKGMQAFTRPPWHPVAKS